jgi:hypothetical protein
MIGLVCGVFLVPTPLLEPEKHISLSRFWFPRAGVNEKHLTHQSVYSPDPLY